MCSVIVPTRSRPASLVGCLEAVSALRWPEGRLEVVVVDDAGSPPAADVVARFADRLQVRVELAAGTGPAAARNVGARAASGALLAFTDDDCRPPAAWLERLAERLAGATRAMAGGPLVNALDDDLWAAASHDVLATVLEHHNADRACARFLLTSNLVLPAALFAETGGFDERFPHAAGEDREFSERARQSGVALLYEPEAPVFHHHTLTMPGLWRQHRNYGSGAAVLRAVTADRGGVQPPLAPKLYLALMQRARRTARGRRGSRRVLGMALTQVAYAVGYFAAKAQRRLG